MAADGREMGTVRGRAFGAQDGNPFVDVTFDVDFALDNRQVPRARLL